MNDHDAIDAINAVLDEWFEGNMFAPDALTQIARITGENKIQHEQARS
ncbi:MAG: hypothetical protein M3O29_00615 [Actinomycetota bacterium]|nr:hypothetical protein [Actinomycetota bacterium]